MGVVLMALVVAAIAVGDRAVLGAGLWSWGFFAAFLVALRLLSKADSSLHWKVVGEPPSEELPNVETPDYSTSGLVLHTASVAAAIFVSGWVLSSSAETLAERSGMGQSFFGVVFVAIATSLPEVSTVVATTRGGARHPRYCDIRGRPSGAARSGCGGRGLRFDRGCRSLPLWHRPVVHT